MERKNFTIAEIDAVADHAACNFCYSANFSFGKGRELDCKDCGENWTPSAKKVAEWVEKNNK